MERNLSTAGLNEYPHVRGWYSPQNERGTSDILWSCGQTMALCAWVSVCVNVPRPEVSRRGLFKARGLLRDKFNFVLLMLLGPEIVFLLAYGQRRAARISAKQFVDPERHEAFKGWTITHAFYANMGGIHVQPRDDKRFPVNAKQLIFLVDGGYMNVPKITEQDIEDRSKAGSLGR